MKKGGYKIIDMGEKEFSPFVAQKVNGAYDAIHGNNRFSVMLSGIVYGGKLLSDTMVNFRKIYDLYKAIILVDGGMLCITIDEDDIVTVKPLQRTDAEAATTLAAGLIKQIEHQPNATPATEDEEKTAPTVTEYNALVKKYNDLLGAMVEAEVMADVPPLTFQALEVGDNVSGGQTIYVNKNVTRQQLEAIFAQSPISLTRCSGGYFPGFVLANGAGADMSKVYLRYKRDVSLYTNIVSLDMSSTTSEPVWSTIIQEDGAFVLPGNVSGTLAEFFGTGWNGVVIGKMA